MTKFLKQTCQLQPAQRDLDGKTVLSSYGDIVYDFAKTVRCRRENTVQDVQTSTGAVVRSSARYFVDASTKVQVDDIIDNHVVLSVVEYTNELGSCEGYECYA